jgi:ABC-type lipoprotein export system ATPase subunit
MPRVDFMIESKVSNSPRVRQLEALFDIPASDKTRREWSGDVTFESLEWNVGLIVGPSGSGKTQVARQLFGVPEPLNWGGLSVIDDFESTATMEDISMACQAVGFNTIPSWLRPHYSLSTGEQFRVELARRLMAPEDPIVIDEFSSVVDRQVAQICSHAVQKYARKHARKFVAVSCHYDIIEWLQPDWILEPATMAFTPRRSLQRRPSLNVEICRVDNATWKWFSPFHYMSAKLNSAATCFCLFVGERPASFGAMINRPHPKVRDIRGLSRLVTLPDWQGLGLAMILSDALGSAYKAANLRMHTYPAHPSLTRSFDRSANWRLERQPGQYGNRGSKSTIRVGGRPCAVFSYCGLPSEAAREQFL